MKEVTIKYKETNIKASFANPPLSRGVVIFVPGKGGSRLSPQEQFIARTLEKGGIGYVLFDILTDKEEKEDFERVELSKNIPFLTERVLAVTRWAREQEGMKDLPLGYFAVGTGSAPALCATAIEPSIKALVFRGAESVPLEGVMENVSAATLFLVASKDIEGREHNMKLMNILDCKKDLKIIGGASRSFEEKGSIEIVAMKSYNWFTVHFGKH